MITIGQSMHPNYVGGDLAKLDEELRLFTEAGVTSCELVLQGLDVIVASRIIQSRQAAVIDILKRHDLQYTMHMPHGMNLMDKDLLEAYLIIFRASIEFAQAAGIKLINYHAGTHRVRKPEPEGSPSRRRRGGSDTDAAVETADAKTDGAADGAAEIEKQNSETTQNEDTTAASADTAEASNKQENSDTPPPPDPKELMARELEEIRILAKSTPEILFCMENALFTDDKEFDEFSPAISVDSMIEFYEGVNLDNFKLTFDISHWFLAIDGDKEVLLNDMKRLLPYIGHIHLHDNCGKRTGPRDAMGASRLIIGAGDIHLPLGWGDLPVKECVELLRDYNGIINLEIEQRFNYHYSEAVSIVKEYLG
ncbi:MAG: sugar phosphate isomerase/epimerase [Oscillospiraceae bacterium]|nr:sugar phosphate isomerase/epimerase [Oscillospiraceae bacterium]